MRTQTVNPIQPNSVSSTGNGVYPIAPLTGPRYNPVLNNQYSNYTQSVPLYNACPPQVAQTPDQSDTMTSSARPAGFSHVNLALFNVRALDHLTGSPNPMNIPGSSSTIN